MKKELKNIASSLASLQGRVYDILTLTDIANKTGRNVTYTTETGSCGGSALMNERKVAVQHAVMEPGTKLKCHRHDEVEVLVLYEGDMSITLPNYVSYLTVGRPFTIEPDTPHIAESVHGAKMIAITIPASPGYPDMTQ